MGGRRARLVVRAPRGRRGPVDGVVLVLHGGRSASDAPTSAGQLAVLRMVPFAAAVRRAARASGRRVVVARLRYRVRGWNGGRQDPVADARWALTTLRERYGAVPVGLVGHSMGGRTAAAVAGEPGVVGVVALAPWLGPGDGVAGVAGRRVLVVHGTADRMTDPRASRRWAERARSVAAAVTYVAVPGGGHPMLRRASLWHRLAAGFTVATVTGSPSPVVPVQDDLRSGRRAHGVAQLLPEALAGVPFTTA